MPRKKRTIIDESLPDKDETLPDDIVDMMVTNTKVYKLNNGGRSFCFQWQEPVDEVLIQERYPMGGKFVALEMNGLGQTVNTVNIDIEPKPMLTPNGNGSNGHSALDIQIQMLRDDLLWSRQMLMQLLGNKSNGSEPTSIVDLVQALSGLHSLAPGGKDPVELLIKGMELGQKSQGGMDWKESLISTVKETALPAIQALSQMRQPQIPVQEAPMQITATPQALLQKGIVWLKSQILSGLDSGLAVEWLLRNANDPTYQPFIENAIRGDINNFIAVDSEIGNEPYRAWFTQAIQILKDEYAAQQNPDTSDVDGGIGNTANHADHEESSSRKSKIKKVV